VNSKIVGIIGIASGLFILINISVIRSPIKVVVFCSSITLSLLTVRVCFLFRWPVDCRETIDRWGIIAFATAQKTMQKMSVDLRRG
jgi:hypothetical protein